MLTKAQSRYLSDMTVLIVLQFLLVAVVVLVGHRLFPRRTCLFTCHLWADFLLYLLVAFGLIVVVHTSETYAVRTAAFMGIGFMLSWVLLIQYNISSNDTDRRQFFLAAVFCAIVLFTASLAIVPLLLPYARTLMAVNGVLVVALVILIVASFFVDNKKRFQTYLIAGLVVFVGLLATDTTRLVAQCRKTGTRECDGPTGATTLYLDLINIIQNIFLLQQK